MTRERNIWSENHSPENFRPEYPEFSMVSLLKETAEKYPDYYALNFNNKKITFAQMIEIIETVAQALLANGVKKGDFVSVVAPNTPHFCLCNQPYGCCCEYDSPTTFCK